MTFKINPSDLKIDTFIGDGSGSFGSRNTTARVTHVPTGLSAQSSDARSLHANRAAACAKLIEMLNERDRHESSRGVDQVRSVSNKLLSDSESAVREILAELHRGYQKAAEPYIERLAQVEAMHPPLPIVINPAAFDRMAGDGRFGKIGPPPSRPYDNGPTERVAATGQNVLIELLTAENKRLNDELLKIEQAHGDTLREFDRRLDATLARAQARSAKMVKLKAALEVISRKCRNYNDRGPGDEGWQSDELGNAFTALNAFLKGEEL